MVNNDFFTPASPLHFLFGFLSARFGLSFRNFFFLMVVFEVGEYVIASGNPSTFLGDVEGFMNIFLDVGLNILGYYVADVLPRLKFVGF